MNATELRRRFDIMMANVTDDELIAEFESMGYHACQERGDFSHVTEAVVTLSQKCEIHSLSVFTHRDMEYAPQEWRSYDNRCDVLNKAVTTKEVFSFSSRQANSEVVIGASLSNELALAA